MAEQGLTCPACPETGQVGRGAVKAAGNLGLGFSPSTTIGILILLLPRFLGGEPCPSLAPNLGAPHAERLPWLPRGGMVYWPGRRMDVPGAISGLGTLGGLPGARLLTLLTVGVTMSCRGAPNAESDSQL